MGSPGCSWPWSGQPTQLRLQGIFDEYVFRKITGKKLRISISRSFHIHKWVGRFRSCGRRKIQNTVTRWIAIFLRTRKMNRKKFQFQNQSWPISTAGDMYFNFATKTRRKPFLEFFRIFQKKFLNSAKNELAIIFYEILNWMFDWKMTVIDSIHVCSHVYMYFKYYM